jgi:hypothetical protein
MALTSDTILGKAGRADFSRGRAPFALCAFPFEPFHGVRSYGASVYVLHVGVRSARCTLRLELHRGCYHMMVAPFLLNVALPHSCLQQQRELRVAV